MKFIVLKILEIQLSTIHQLAKRHTVFLNDEYILEMFG